MNKYRTRKEYIREEAIGFYADETNLSYESLMIAQDYFSKMAKRYGLIKEFRENGII